MFAIGAVNFSFIGYINLSKYNSQFLTMSFAVHDPYIILYAADKIIITNIKTRNESEVIPKFTLKDENKKQQLKTNVESTDITTAVIFSNDGKYFCICKDRKQLAVYCMETQKFIYETLLPKAASKMTFTEDDDIVVVNKSGDTHLFSFKNSERNGKLILGHLSMLLDVMVTHDGKHIITADRDEKIRVSKFPNSYTIESFCLGHTSFVNNICQLPHEEEVLISVGGDGYIKFWNYIKGDELMSVKFSDKVQEKQAISLNENLRSLGLTETDQALPAKFLRACKVNENSSLLVLTFFGSADIFVYRVEGSILKGGKVDLLRTIVEGEVYDIHFYNNRLWTLSNYGLRAWKLKGELLAYELETAIATQNTNETWKTLLKDVNKEIIYPLLYKRIFNDPAEDISRKKCKLTIGE